MGMTFTTVASEDLEDAREAAALTMDPRMVLDALVVQDEEPALRRRAFAALIDERYGAVKDQVLAREALADGTQPITEDLWAKTKDAAVLGLCLRTDAYWTLLQERGDLVPLIMTLLDDEEGREFLMTDIGRAAVELEPGETARFAPGFDRDLRESLVLCGRPAQIVVQTEPLDETKTLHGFVVDLQEMVIWVNETPAVPAYLSALYGLGYCDPFNELCLEDQADVIEGFKDALLEMGAEDELASFQDLSRDGRVGILLLHMVRLSALDTALDELFDLGVNVDPDDDVLEALADLPVRLTPDVTGFRLDHETFLEAAGLDIDLEELDDEDDEVFVDELVDHLRISVNHVRRADMVYYLQRLGWTLATDGLDPEEVISHLDQLGWFNGRPVFAYGAVTPPLDDEDGALDAAIEALNERWEEQVIDRHPFDGPWPVLLCLDPLFLEQRDPKTEVLKRLLIQGGWTASAEGWVPFLLSKSGEGVLEKDLAKVDRARMPLAAFTRHGQDTTGLEAMKDLAMARYTALPAPMRAAMGPRTRESLQTIVTPSLWMGLANEESVRMMKFMQELERRAGL